MAKTETSSMFTDLFVTVDLECKLETVFVSLVQVGNLQHLKMR